MEALDEVIERYRLPPPDWIKIDVEGMEAEVLTGASETLRRFHPQMVVEIHGAGCEGKLQNARRVLELTHAHGYKCRHIETQSELEPGEAARALRGHLYCY